MAGYGLVMKSTILNDDLTAEAKSIYAFLCVHADPNGYCYPSVDYMCKRLGMGEDRFYKHMNLLKRTGVIEVIRKRNGSQFAHNIYRLTDRPSPENQGTELLHSLEMNLPKIPGRDCPSPENSGSNNTHANIPKDKNKTRKNIYMRVLNLLNEGKRKASSKGRLKYRTMTIDDLLEDGLSENEIIQAAQEIARNGINTDWYDFEKYCKAHFK